MDRGLIFLLIDKRPFVKFHAAQSIALNIAFFAVWLAFSDHQRHANGDNRGVAFPHRSLELFPCAGDRNRLHRNLDFHDGEGYGHEKYKLPIIGNMVEGMVK